MEPFTRFDRPDCLFPRVTSRDRIQRFMENSKGPVIVGVLLAAGRGSRFGGRKLVASLPDGMQVGARAARTLRGAVDSGVAVVRPGDAELSSLFSREGLTPLPFDRADEGMGASLSFGVSSTPDALGWVVALADMPFVQPETVEAVCRKLREGAWIVVPSHGGRRGHPVAFSRSLRGELVQLGGDKGARSVLSKHSERVVTLECDDPGILLDVDTPDDLSKG